MKLQLGKDAGEPMIQSREAVDTDLFYATRLALSDWSYHRLNDEALGERFFKLLEAIEVLHRSCVQRNRERA